METLPPAGWYPDPADPRGLRWWDGAQWGPQAPRRSAPQPAATDRAAYQPAQAPTPNPWTPSQAAPRATGYSAYRAEQTAVPEFTQQDANGAGDGPGHPADYGHQLPSAYPQQPWDARPPYYGQDSAAFGQPKPANAPATWAHLGALLTWAAGFAFSPFAFFCFVAPFIIRSKWKNDPFVRHHTTQSLNSALTGLALFLVTLGLEPLAGRWVELVALSFGIARAVCEIIGVVKAHKGEEFRFPAWVAFRFVKDEPPALSLRTKVAAGVACAAALVLTPLTLLAGGTSATHFQPADARNVNPPNGSCEIAYPLGGTGLNMEVVVTYPAGNGSAEPCSAQQTELDSMSGLEGVFVPGTYARIGVPASCSGTLDGGAVAYAAFVISPSGYSDVFCAGVQG